MKNMVWIGLIGFFGLGLLAAFALQPTQSGQAETHTPSAAVYLPLVLTTTASPSDRDITADFHAQALLASCAVYTDDYGFRYAQAYHCENELMNTAAPVAPAGMMIAARAWSATRGSQITRTYVEYALPDDLPFENITGVQFCFNTQYWQPDAIHFSVGDWIPGAIQEALQSQDYTEFFTSQVWNNYAEPFFTLPALPAYYREAPCTEFVVPVTSESAPDGILRWVIRTGDEIQPTEGSWGAANYTIQEGQYLITDVRLEFQP